MKHTVIYFLLVILSTTKTIGQNMHKQQIDSFITNAVHTFKEIPGLSITVVKNGEPFFTKSYGFSNIEKKAVSSPETSYYIASVTKSFVGLLAAKLDADGIIDIDKPVTHYKPISDFKDQSLFENVTIRDLLSHTSGIRNSLLTWKFASIGEYNDDAMVRLLENKTSSLYNNKRFRYDNFGYNVFDLILKKELGLSWKHLLYKEIFSPLGMNHTSAFMSEAQKKKWNLASPYTAINDEELPKEANTQKNDDTFQAAGGMIASIEDMQKFLLLNMNKGKLNNKIIFNEDIISASQAPIAKNKGRKGLFTPEAYGLGWNIGLFRDKKVHYHFGGFDGYFSHLSFLPDEHIGIVVLTNESHFGDNVSNLIAGFIYDLLTNKITSTSDYTNKVEDVKKRVAQLQKDFREDRGFRAKRKWTLMHDFDQYSGVYTNKHIGNLIISLDHKGNLKAKLGISEAITSPSTADESVRVEFRDSRGIDILFISNEKGTMAAVYQGYVFLRQKS